MPDSNINLDAVARESAQKPATSDESRPAFMRVKSTKAHVVSVVHDDEVEHHTPAPAPAVSALKAPVVVQMATLNVGRQNSHSSDEGEVTAKSPLMGASPVSSSSSSSANSNTAVLPSKSGKSGGTAGPATSIAFSFAPKRAAEVP